MWNVMKKAVSRAIAADVPAGQVMKKMVAAAAVPRAAMAAGSAIQRGIQRRPDKGTEAVHLHMMMTMIMRAADAAIAAAVLHAAMAAGSAIPKVIQRQPGEAIANIAI